jgi:DNA polymerase
MAETLVALYEEMKSCNACGLREMCRQVVPSVGQTDAPRLLIIGEAPGEQEDIQGEPFVGVAGKLLRLVLRETGVLNRANTLIANTIRCRPPNNKFPRDECPSICVGKWLNQEIALAKPDRMLLLGNVPLKYVAGLTGITRMRGQWISARGIRTMPTFHPSYVMRQENEGDPSARSDFESDIGEVAREVAEALAHA